MNRVRTASFGDHLLGLGLAVVYAWSLFATSFGLAMSRDESFYAHAAESYGRWYELLAQEPSSALQADVIAKHWEYNHEHPALMKTLFAWSWLAQKHRHIFPTDGVAFRFPSMVISGLFLWLVYIFGVRAHGRLTGLFAAFALALMPRVFYHAHLDCFDVPIAFMLTLVTYCYWRSLDRWIWVIWTGVAYGLALATKHNAWILPGVFLVHWLWVRLSTPKAFLPKPARWPWWLLSSIALGVPVFVASWPWLWSETVERFRWYAAFHLHHVNYSIQYLGTTYWKPPFPRSYAWVMIAFTVPAATLALCATGILRRWRDLLPPIFTRRLRAREDDARATTVLWFGAMLAPVAVYMIPTTPIFGGTKHWFPAYPFVALFAGLGFSWLVEQLSSFNRTGTSLRDRVVAGGCFVVMLAPALIETIHSHPFGLSFYSPAAGGVPGAADLGMNRQFWGFTQGSLADWFKRAMPNGGTVWICDATSQSWRMMQRDGMIPTNIRDTGNLANADYAIVHHEQHFAEVDFQIWEAFGTVAPVKVLTYDGVPIVSVYRNARVKR